MATEEPDATPSEEQPTGPAEPNAAPGEKQPAGPPPLVQGQSKDERMWAMFCHLAALAGGIFPAFGNIIGPLVVWLIKKEEYPLVDDQGKESVNFQITLSIAGLILVPLCFLLIGIPLILALTVYGLVMIIIAAMKANEGERYRYPYTIRFIK